MGQRGTAKDTDLWYVIGSHGNMVVRVRPGMPLGETATGELSFDPSCAQVELDIADDGGLVLRAVDDHELESPEGTRCRRECLPRNRRAEVRLPHNLLKLNPDFAERAAPADTVKIRAVRPAERITKPRIEELPGPVPGNTDSPVVAARPPQRSTSRSSRGGGTAAAGTPPLEPKVLTPPPQPARAPEPDKRVDAPPSEAKGDIPRPQRAPRPAKPKPHKQTVAERMPDRPSEPTRTRRQRILGPSLAVLIGLAGIGFAFLYSGFREGSAPEPSVTVGPPAATQNVGAAPVPQTAPEQAPSAAAGAAGPGADASPEPPPVTAPTIEPVVLPPVERRSISQVARTAGAAESAANPETIPSKPASKPDPAVVAELEAVGVAAKAMAEELALRRDLHAAHLALLQGRLTTPPEASAYTLYNRVLAQDPGSPEALTGLQSVRQGLINRALAQLAGSELNDARRSLRAAADAGANPLLVADLRDEVDHRQRLMDARAGRFDTLYPVDKLVAVNRKPPRLARRASSGAEVSVEVQFTVTARGDVSDVTVLGDPSENIAQAVQRAVREWRFEPVLDNGRPIPVRSSVRFTFGN